ncbi:MAG: hypothetical protein ACRD29_23595 [Acidimicrobiales bacterium]
MSGDFEPPLEDLPGDYDIEPARPAEVVEKRRRSGPAFVVGAVAAAAVVTFGFQNTASVPVQFLWFDGEAPLWVAMGSVAVVAVVLVKAIGLAIRTQGRRRRGPAA